MQRQKQIAELHRVVGPFGAFLVTQTDGPAFTRALSIVLRLFLNVYFSLLIKINQLLLCYFGFTKTPTIKECCAERTIKTLFRASINLRLDVPLPFVQCSQPHCVVWGCSLP